MTTKVVEKGNKKIAVINSSEVVIDGQQSAMDLIASVAYENDCSALVINKDAVSETFFDLSSGLAGEVLQKFVNYHMQLAVVGDFSKYTSKALKDFIYESNEGKQAYFVATEEEAIEKLLS